MTILKICFAALASALASAFFTVWLMSGVTVDEPTLSPLLFSQDGGDQVVWGSWRTVRGYNYPASQSTEIRCSKARMTCVEGLGLLLIHEKGQDLEAQAFEYRVEEWSDSTITATAVTPMGECTQRKLSLQLKEETGSLSWAPGAGCKEGDEGKAVLVGDATEL